MPVIDGAFIAFMMDTYGLGLSEYRQMCRDRGYGFTLSGLILGFIKQGRPLDKIKATILEEGLPQGIDEGCLMRMIVKVHARFAAGEATAYSVLK